MKHLNRYRITLLLLLIITIQPIHQLSSSKAKELNQNSYIAQRSPLILNQSEYQFIWEEFANASGNLPGDDIITYGSIFGPFHNYTEIITKLQDAQQYFPAFIDLFSIGQTYFGNDIWCVKITDKRYMNPTQNKTQILFVAQHHAREQITVENALYAMDKILFEAIGSNPEILSILREKEIYIIPSLNIDGASIIHKIPWQRKTLRPIDENQDGVDDNFNSETSETIIDVQDVNGDNYIECIGTTNGEYLVLGYEGNDLDDLGDYSFRGVDTPGGVDPNRNYDYGFNTPYSSSSDPRSQVFHGNTPFSENCTRVLRDFIQDQYFQASVSLHSGIEAIYFPEVSYSTAKSSTGEEKLKEVDFFNEVTSTLSALTGFPYSPMGNNGMFSPWIYFNEEQLQVAVCLETWGNESSYQYLEINEALNYERGIGIWDYFNPPANQVINNSALVFKGLLYLLEKEYNEYPADESQIPPPDDSSTISSYRFLPIFTFLSFMALGVIFKRKLEFSSD